MNYTDEQFAEISKYEDNFRTAVQGNWSRNIPIPEIKRLRAIYEEAAKTRFPLNVACGTCRLNLLKRAGKLYFADKEERIAAANAAEAAAKTIEEAKPKKAPAKSGTKSTKKTTKK